MVLEKTLQSPLDCNEVQPVHPKADQSWVFTGRTDAEVPVLWPPDAKNCLIGKDPDAKDWRWEEKGTTEDEMIGWHHWINACEFEHALGVDDEQGSLVCCIPWGRKELNTTEQLNWTEMKARLCLVLKATIKLPLPKCLCYFAVPGAMNESSGGSTSLAAFGVDSSTF